jgi:hypothetical protein
LEFTSIGQKILLQNLGLYFEFFIPFNAELNPICQLLALLAHHILHVSRIRVNVDSDKKGLHLTVGYAVAQLVEALRY